MSFIAQDVRVNGGSFFELWQRPGIRPGSPETTWRRMIMMIEKERRTVWWKSRATLRALAVNRSGRKENVKAFCALWRREI